MATLVVMIECQDSESAANLQRAFKKNTLGYKTSIVIDSSGNTGIHNWLKVTLSTDIGRDE